MSKRIRQYIAIFAAILSYYLIHEGAHFLYALSVGAFKQVNFFGLGILGVQIDIFRERITDPQLGILCLVGPAASLAAAYAMCVLTPWFCSRKSKVFRTVTYYVTLVFLILDPLYLSILCGFFGGGDMNGIALLVPEAAARIVFGLLLIVNFWVFRKWVYPLYKKSFA